MSFINCRNGHVNMRNHCLQRHCTKEGEGLLLNMIHKQPITKTEMASKGSVINTACANVVGGFYNKNCPERNDIKTEAKAPAPESNGGSLLRSVKIPLTNLKKEKRNNIKFVL